MRLTRAIARTAWFLLTFGVGTLLTGCTAPTEPYIHETSLAGSPGQPGVTDWDADTQDRLDLHNPLVTPVRMWVVCVGNDKYESDVPANDVVSVLITELVRDAGHACERDAWEPL